MTIPLFPRKSAGLLDILCDLGHIPEPDSNDTYEEIESMFQVSQLIMAQNVGNCFTKSLTKFNEERGVGDDFDLSKQYRIDPKLNIDDLRQAFSSWNRNRNSIVESMSEEGLQYVQRVLRIIQSSIDAELNQADQNTR